MLVWDPETRDDAVRRAERNVLNAAQGVVYWRSRGQLTVEHLDALADDVDDLDALTAEWINPTPPACRGDLKRAPATLNPEEQSNSTTSTSAGLTTRDTGR